MPISEDCLYEGIKHRNINNMDVGGFVFPFCIFLPSPFPKNAVMEYSGLADGRFFGNPNLCKKSKYK